MDESENQEEGSLGRHAARNGLASATLPVRVVSALSVNPPSHFFIPIPGLLPLCSSLFHATLPRSSH